MSSPTQGAWACQHNVDGRDFCPECYAPAPRQVLRYSHTVEVDDGPGKRRSLYRGDDFADAMAAWSRAVEAGGEYVMLESLRARVRYHCHGCGGTLTSAAEAEDHKQRHGLVTNLHDSSLHMAMAEHDGYAAHSHEVRPDHDGVHRKNPEEAKVAALDDVAHPDPGPSLYAEGYSVAMRGVVPDGALYLIQRGGEAAGSVLMRKDGTWRCFDRDAEGIPDPAGWMEAVHAWRAQHNRQGIWP